MRQIVAIALVSCGRIGFQPVNADGDSGTTIISVGRNSDDVGGCADTHIIMDAPNATPGANDVLNTDAQANHARALIAFDVSVLPPGVVVAAKLELRVASMMSSASPDCDVTVHELRETWDELAASWIDRSANAPWLAQGADPPSSSTDLVGVMPAPYPNDTLHTLALPSQLVESWRANVQNPGVLLVCSSSNGIQFVSSEGFDGKRPRLRVSLE